MRLLLFLLRRSFLGSACVCFLFCGSLWGETRALIVVGLAGESTIWEDFQTERDTWREALLANDIPAENIVEVVSLQGKERPQADQKNTRDQVLAVFEEWQKVSTEDTDLVLILIGHSSTRGERYTFQVRGKRLKKPDFVAALAKISRRSLTNFITGPGGSGLVDALAEEGVVSVSATLDENQINHTRFGTKLAENLAQDAQAPLHSLLKQTEEAVANYYQERGLARSENSILQLASAPPLEGPDFALDEASELWAETWSLARLGTPSLLPAEVVEPASANQASRAKKEMAPVITDTPQVWEFPKLTAEAVPYLQFREATADELSWFEDFPDAEAYPDQPGVLYFRKMQKTIGADYSFTGSLQARLCVFDSGIRRVIDRIVNNGGAGSQRLLHLKTIHPDGRVIEFDIGELRQRKGEADFTFFVPGIGPGVIVDYAYEFKDTVDNSRGYHFTLPIVDAIPVRLFEYSLKIAKADLVRWKLYGDFPGEHREEADAYSVEHRWEWKDLPAYEWEASMPFLKNPLPRIAFSSYRSWDDFTEWYGYISDEQDKPTEMVIQQAAVLSEGLSSEDEKIRAVYNYVSALRYVAIEVGVNAVRARSPVTVMARQYGDCKDKANLLTTLLREMGIPAHFVLVNRGQPFDIDFPSWQFNHAIAVVERKDGSLFWVDTTDESCPLGMLPPGDNGQQGLVFARGEKPYFAPIPNWNRGYSAEQKIDLQWSEEGANPREGILTYQLGGYAEYFWRSHLRRYGKRDTRRALAAYFSRLWPDFQMQSCQLNITDDLSAPASVELRFTAVSSNPPPLLDLQNALASWQRSQPLAINSEYPLAFSQKIKLSQKTGKADFEVIHPEYQMSVTDMNDTAQQSAYRVSQLRTTQGFLSPEALPAFRKHYYQWIQATQK